MAVGWLPNVYFPEGLLATPDTHVRLRALAGVGLGEALELQLQCVKMKLRALPYGKDGKRQRQKLHGAERELEAVVAAASSLASMSRAGLRTR